ncbi:hypothetical protein [Psychrobacillus lasiicapitis]|uniref:Uncharacterized protein n=1 Tax=Psychrobacillus lasiicapitis TaxID=1636719 RepID=A0A544TAI4_9BACI|nr:hypothetical protein [Psychrobacillus lasiicapitis]TQR14465.1 hypothetical protein FG382_08395 [Psychrobacillus lasiicapitis]GGA31101.1 hypothetical protein GCM10011384_20750 [Psychrobacillus lasiicapitis]
MSMYNFVRLINKYSGPITAYEKSEGAWINGKWVEGKESPVIRSVAIIPFDMKTIAQLGGLITNGDAQIYSLKTFQHGDKIERNGHKYLVDTSGNFTPFGDFYRYIAKGVSSFD